MSDDKDIDDLPSSGDVAAEYVLGTLTAPERADAEQRLLNDPEFTRAVATWEARLAPLLDAIPEAEPPKGVFYDVRQAIGGVSHKSVPTPTLSGETENVIRFDLAERSMRKWRRRALASGAIAASLLAFVFFREVYEPTIRADGTYVAILESEGRDAAFVATIDTTSGAIAVRRLGADAETGHSHELWAVGGGREKPQSLGVIGSHLRVSSDQLGTADAKMLKETIFAVSVEPQGGSTTGQPTGPVVFTGKLVPAPLPQTRTVWDRLKSMWTSQN